MSRRETLTVPGYVSLSANLESSHHATRLKGENEDWPFELGPVHTDLHPPLDNPNRSRNGASRAYNVLQGCCQLVVGWIRKAMRDEGRLKSDYGFSFQYSCLHFRVDIQGCRAAQCNFRNDGPRSSNPRNLRQIHDRGSVKKSSLVVFVLSRVSTLPDS